MPVSLFMHSWYNVEDLAPGPTQNDFLLGPATETNLGRDNILVVFADTRHVTSFLPPNSRSSPRMTATHRLAPEAYLYQYFLSPMIPLVSAPDTSLSAAGTISGSSLKKPSRRAPHCSKCHRPRAGHPRKGCPYVSSTTSDAAQTQEFDLSRTLQSMTISESVHDQGSAAEPTRPTRYVSGK